MRYEGGKKKRLCGSRSQSGINQLLLSSHPLGVIIAAMRKNIQAPFLLRDTSRWARESGRRADVVVRYTNAREHAMHDSRRPCGKRNLRAYEPQTKPLFGGHTMNSTAPRQLPLVPGRPKGEIRCSFAYEHLCRAAQRLRKLPQEHGPGTDICLHPQRQDR
jgi:hypothetical protein